jgi:hypothetical protein
MIEAKIIILTKKDFKAGPKYGVSEDGKYDINKLGLPDFKLDLVKKLSPELIIFKDKSKVKIFKNRFSSSFDWKRLEMDIPHHE